MLPVWLGMGEATLGVKVGSTHRKVHRFFRTLELGLGFLSRHFLSNLHKQSAASCWKWNINSYIYRVVTKKFNETIVLKIFDFCKRLKMIYMHILSLLWNISIIYYNILSIQIHHILNGDTPESLYFAPFWCSPSMGEWQDSVSLAMHPVLLLPWLNYTEPWKFIYQI